MQRCITALVAALVVSSGSARADGVAIGQRTYWANRQVLAITGYVHGDRPLVILDLKVYVLTSGVWVQYSTAAGGWIGYESNFFDVGLYRVSSNATVKLVLTIQPEYDWLEGTGLNVVEEEITSAP